MASLPASAEPQVEWTATPAAVHESASRARLSAARVLGGIGLVVLCGVLFWLAVRYLSAPSLGPDLWSDPERSRGFLELSGDFETVDSGKARSSTW